VDRNTDITSSMIKTDMSTDFTDRGARLIFVADSPRVPSDFALFRSVRHFCTAFRKPQSLSGATLRYLFKKSEV